MTFQLIRKRLTSNLPAAACEDDMLEQLKEVAKLEKTSESAVIRYALSLFLADYFRKSRKNTVKAKKESGS